MATSRQPTKSFATGNASKVLPVTRIGERALQPGPLYRKARGTVWAFAAWALEWLASLHERCWFRFCSQRRVRRWRRTMCCSAFYAAVRGAHPGRIRIQNGRHHPQVLGAGAPVAKIAPIKERMKMLSYNRAVLFASCAAEAEKDRPLNAARIPGRTIS